MYFEFGQPFAGQEAAALRLETNDSAGDSLVPLILQM